MHAVSITRYAENIVQANTPGIASRNQGFPFGSHQQSSGFERVGEACDHDSRHLQFGGQGIDAPALATLQMVACHQVHDAQGKLLGLGIGQARFAQPDTQIARILHVER